MVPKKSAKNLIHRHLPIFIWSLTLLIILCGISVGLFLFTLDLRTFEKHRPKALGVDEVSQANIQDKWQNQITGTFGVSKSENTNNLKKKILTYDQKNQFLFQLKDGEFVLQSKDKLGQYHNLNQASILDTGELTLETTGETIYIRQHRYLVATNFPLMVDHTTNQIIFTTPIGRKTLTVLPEKAVRNLVDQYNLNVSYLNRNPIMDLVLISGELCYQLSVVQMQKFLGLISYPQEKLAYISAENGAVKLITTSDLDWLLDILST